MPALNSSILTTCLGVAASYLIFSIFVQTVQEVYKYLTNSKGRAYGNALEDFVGSLAKQLTAPGGLPDLRVRGPFQLLRLRPGGLNLPLGKDQLISGLEGTLSPTISQALDAFNFEAQLQKGQAAPPSPAFSQFLDGIDQSKPTNSTASMVSKFLGQWCPEIKKSPSEGTDQSTPAVFDAEQVLAAFRREFLSHVDDAAAQFPQFISNFQYTYKRRNLRQTFVIAFLAAYLFHLSFLNIYDNASKMPPQQAVALATQAMALYTANVATNNIATNSVATNNIAARNVATNNITTNNITTNNLIAHNAVTNKVATNNPPSADDYAALETKMQQATAALQSVAQTDFLAAPKLHMPSIAELFDCLVSALLVSFGAPFWNDLASYFLNAQKNAQPKPEVP